MMYRYKDIGSGRVFEWDPKKDEANFRKHGIRFRQALEVFNDKLAVTVQDRIENGELRWRTIGTIGSSMFIMVAHTLQVGDIEVIRIISARKLDKKERRIYENCQI